MRLINVQTLQLTEFLDARQRPKYVIASHRWAPDESSFKDLRKGRNKHYSGYKKIDGFAQYIRQSYPAIEWLWIDTCCVNKESDAELSYAINSMFDWYRNAEVCVARLGILPSNYTPEQLKQDQWFWRGWTLQELLAPRVVVFVDHDWRAIGHKGIGSQGTGPNIAKAIASITGISEAVLGDWGASVNLRLEEKMKWMTNRDTTREEDMIYALFGIVGVSMSVIYGEGKDRASARLVAAIHSRDDTKQRFGEQHQHLLNDLSSSTSTSSEGPRSIPNKKPQSFWSKISISSLSGHLAQMRKNGRALEKAVTARDYQALKMLLDRGIDANSRSGPGESALIMACKLRRIDLVKALLDAGADANTIALFEYHYVRAYYKYTRHKVTENETALGAAVVSGHVEIVHALINAGADVTTPTAGTTSRDLLHGTPLDLAICCGHVSIVEVLLSAGADINTDKLRTWDNLNHNFRPDPMPLYRNQILAELEDARAKDILAGRANEN